MPIEQGGMFANRPAHDDRTTLIEADDVKRIPADIDTLVATD